ncbi:DinB family protein [Pueribacillus theae]|uniref:DinB family protein n=1 Tax=Pueribacillus theae TaxID=2171751 RepID=A0A2U1JU76_9BACI|nr:DinB family protein [Pueribacillus theae]PWA08398.1 DinB family protein [Pueribacillus theae]
MNEDMLFTIFEKARKNTLGAAKKIAEKNPTIVDVIPEGFNNNIRWNLGHIAAICDQLMNFPAGEKPLLPKPFNQSFSNGTSPKDWNDETPTYDDIVQALEAQPQQLKERYAGKLSDPLPKPFSLVGIDFQTVGDLLVFVTYHEGMHQGTIGALQKVAK